MELQRRLLLLLLLLLRVEANNLTEVKVELGQSVTITCSGNSLDLYWFIQIHGNLRGFIGRTFSGKQDQNQYFPSDRSKFLLQENRLNITNVTADDCRLYYCGNRNNTGIHYLDTFRLVSDVPPPSPPPCPSSSPDPVLQEEKSTGSLLFSDPVLYGSLTFNGLFVLVTIGLASVFLCCKKKNSRDFLVDEPSPVTYEMPQYEEIRFPSSVGPAAAAPECIYYKAQLPGCTLPPPH